MSHDFVVAITEPTWKCIRCNAMLVHDGICYKNFESLAPRKMLCMECSADMNMWLYDMWVEQTKI